MSTPTFPAGLDAAQAWQLLPQLVAALEAHRTDWPSVTTRPGAPGLVCPACGGDRFGERHVAVSTSPLETGPVPGRERGGLLGVCVPGEQRVDSLGFCCLACGVPVTIPAGACRITHDGTAALDMVPSPVAGLLTRVADQVAVDDLILEASGLRAEELEDYRAHDELHADLNEHHDDLLHQVLDAFDVAPVGVVA